MAQGQHDTADRVELTFRSIVLGGLITVFFTAANVYLGLKVGLTFATSIPAAVISMGLLQGFARSSIHENNIVQTVASAAGTLSAIIFVLPGLVMLGWWQNFDFITTTLICLTGGILGVMFSVPLRRALVVGSGLPYPEGRAAAEVLKVGAGSREGSRESAIGMRIILINGLASAGWALLGEFKLVASKAAAWFHLGPAATGVAGSLSFALLGAGHLVGLAVGMAMLTGLVLGWWIVLPVLTALAETSGSAAQVAETVFTDDVRFVGAGVIGVAALWTLLRLIMPVARGIRAALAASAAARGGRKPALVERDIPIGIVGLVIVLMLVPIAWLLSSLIADGPLAASAWPLLVGSLLFIIVTGLVIAAVSGYMAGLIGASNSPLSGIGILAIVAAALLLVGLFGREQPAQTTQALVAYALIVTAVVFGVATISNDNLQDLKTGQLVGATPWKQQVALLFGVGFGSLVIPLVMELLNTAFGFAGAANATADALPAPQAALIASLAKGVLGGDLNWSMIGLGAAIGALAVVVDAGLARSSRMRLPALAIGIGMYLPMTVTLPVVIGSVIGFVYDRWAEKRGNAELARRLGVLTATGLIVGESLFGVVFAGIVAASGASAPLALVGAWFAPIAWLPGVVLFFVVAALLYGRTRSQVLKVAV